MRLLSSALLCALPLTAHAFGNDTSWESGFGQGILEAVITQGSGNSIHVTCDTGADRNATGITFEVGGKTPEGSNLVLVFDDRPPEQVWITDGGIPTDCRACAGTYEWVVERLRKHSKVHVMTESGQTATFSLTGASRAIGECVPDIYR